MQLPAPTGVEVLVVGDLMLDRYWSGAARRVSPEAPVPILDVERQDDRPGGAANVALNLVGLGAACTLVGAVGKDPAGQALTRRLAAAGVRLDLIEVPDWPTSVKLRLSSQRQQLLRADLETPLPTALAPRIEAAAARHLERCGCLLLQDYDKGVLDAPERLLAQADRRAVPVVVDPKGKPFGRYRGARVVKPNEAEFLGAVSRELQAPPPPSPTTAQLADWARQLCRRDGVDSLLITRGAGGMLCVEAAAGVSERPGRTLDVFDVTGAGDTAAAALAVAVALGWTLAEAAELANQAAGLAVTRSGTTVVSAPEVNAALAGEAPGRGGILNQQQLAQAVAAARQRGERLVFTNGCFDLLHAGHVSCLNEARRLGDRLIVAVNDDASVTRLKGAGRPIHGLDARLRVVAGLAAVDWVVAFDDDTPEALLDVLRPDVLVKGGDYRLDQVVGAALVRSYGGEVRVLSEVPGLSTSAALDRLSDAAPD